MEAAATTPAETPLPHAIWAWAVVAWMIFTGFWIQLVIFLLTRPFDPQQRACAQFYRVWGGWTADLMGLWDFRVHGPFQREIPGKTVIVANHVSQADPFIVSRLPWHLKYLAKQELYRLPFFGWSLRLSGHVPIRRRDRDSIRRAMSKCAQWLRLDVPVLIFPEGTRSETGELTSFKDGAFRLAIESGADILPVAIAGTREALPKHSNRPGRAKGLISAGRIISTRGKTLDDLAELKDAARAQINAMLAEIRPLARVD